MLFFAINGDKNLTNLCQKKITIITPNNNKNNTINTINSIVFIIKYLYY